MGGSVAPSTGVDKKKPRVKAILGGFPKMGGWYPSQKSSILIGFFSIYVHHPFWGKIPIFEKHPFLGLGFNLWTNFGHKFRNSFSLIMTKSAWVFLGQRKSPFGMMGRLFN